MTLLLQLAPFIAQIVQAVVKAIAEKNATLDSVKAAAHDAVDAYIADDLAAALAANEATVAAENPPKP